MEFLFFLLLSLLLVAPFAFFIHLFVSVKKIFKVPHRNICERYKIAKKREKFKQEIITKIATEDYKLDEFHSWFYFNINGRREVFGILEMIDYFGSDVFKRAELRKQEIKKSEKKKTGLYLIVDNTKLNKEYV